MSRKKWMITAAAALLLILAVILVTFTGGLKESLWERSQTEEPAAGVIAITDATRRLADGLGMTPVAETGSLALLINEPQALIGVLNKEDGRVYYSHPKNADSDPGATPYYQERMQADLTVTFYNEYVQASEMDSYTACVVDEQAEFEYSDNGVTVVYTLGQTATKLILPTAISEERFNALVSGMEEKTQKKVKRNYTFLDTSAMRQSDIDDQLEKYPGLALHNLYILKDGTKDYLREELEEYFIEQGYTAEELLADMEENCGETASKKPWFIIPVSYRLENDSFVAEIDPSKLSYNDEGYYLTDIDLLPYFGAADTAENGYMFVPDGSGALIYLNNGKTTQSAYSDKVYGVDFAQTSLSFFKSELEEDFSIKLPVFGLKAGDGAWIAMIEQGAGYADISADISGKTTSYNHIWPGFSYMTCGSISLGSIVGANSFYMYSHPDTAENYRVRWMFLTGDKADYCGMASAYRDYLTARGMLNSSAVLADTPFYVEYIGAINKDKSTMGIKYNATVAVTSFKAAAELTDKLAAAGVSDLRVIMSGWTKGGLKGEAQISVKPERALKKGGMDIGELSEHLSASGIGFYPVAELQLVEDNTATDGYSLQSHAPRYFDRSIVKGSGYIYANGIKSKMIPNLISPVYATGLAETTASRLKKLGMTGVAVNSLTHELFSDYDEDKYTDRQMAKDLNTDALRILSDSFGGQMLGYNSNDYALAGLSELVNAPTASNHLRLIDEDVPFYEIVLKGSVNMAGQALNLADDHRREVLKSAECGMGMYYKWIEADNSVVVDTFFDELYSVNSDTWFDTAADEYRELSQACRGLGDKRITGHELLGNGVTKTTFEDGSVMAVNFGRSEATVDGVRVGAESFVRLR